MKRHASPTVCDGPPSPGGRGDFNPGMWKLTVSKDRKEPARELRHRQTEAENKLWSVLRRKALGQYKFRRQFPFGPFFADFCCIGRRLIIEVDGGYHIQTSDADSNRSFCFEERGFRVVRFTNQEVLNNLYDVQVQILKELKKPSPLPPGEGTGRRRRPGGEA